MISLGQRIKQARQASGYTQTQIASKLGCSVNTISRWEHDKFKPSGEDMLKLEKILVCSFSEEDDGSNLSEYNALAMQLEDIRLELAATQKSKNRLIVGLIVTIVAFIFLFIIYAMSFQYIDPNAHNEPIKIVEYYEAEGCEE